MSERRAYRGHLQVFTRRWLGGFLAGKVHALMIDYPMRALKNALVGSTYPTIIKQG